MKKNLLLSSILFVAASLVAADSTSKDEVKNAAKKLAEKSNYSWRTTYENAGGGGFQMGPVDGKTEKDGVTYIKVTRNDNTTEAVLKGEKGAIKMADEGWRSLADAAQDDQGPGRFAARMMRNFRTPAIDAEDIAAKVNDLKSSDGVYSGDLTEAGAKQLMTFRMRGGGGNGPEVSGAKGSAKFWIKDGVLTKYQYNVKGNVSFNGNDRDVDRTTTVEIKDVGSTKVSVPEEAEKKL
jgi:hypothetical protein